MKRFLTLALAACLCAAGLLAQQPNFKSQEEFDAFVAVQNAASLCQSERLPVSRFWRPTRRAKPPAWQRT